MPAITDVDELQAMENDLAGNYWLANDINAAVTSGWWGGAGFIPIGDAANPFTGIFRGLNHPISDLFINRPGTNYVGLFGVADTPSEISKVILSNVDITGDSYVGGLGGLVNGVVSYCRTTGNVTSIGDRIGGLIGNYGGDSLIYSYSTAIIVCGSNTAGGLIGRLNLAIGGIVNQCYATGSVTATTSNTGGLIGRSYGGNIMQSYAMGNVISTTPSDNIGGFIGYANSGDGSLTISDSYARGSVNGDDDVGGFAGYNADTIQRCHSTGAITGLGANVGGFCGSNFDTISDCFWDTETSGEAASDGGAGKTTSQMKTKSTFTDADWDFIIIWGINKITNAGYPFHWAMPPEPPPDAPRATVAVKDKITLECVRNVEMAAGGRFFINKEGKAAYRSRYARNA